MRAKSGGRMAKYQIITDFARPANELIERANATFVGVTGVHAGPRQVMHAAIKPLKPEWRLCGPAFTVKPEYTEDLLLGELAAKYAKPGDVLVVDAGGRSDTAVWGAGMTRGAQMAGCAGVVVDGPTMNSTTLYRYDLPVFSRGAMAHAYGGASRAGWMNVPVQCGGVVVFPGDIVLADADGVVVLPKDRADAILRKSEGYGNTARARSDTPVPYYVAMKSEEKMRTIEDIEWR
jgi:4-hydroxy-4-methyl-2-oxoglutarate aldolase